MKSILSILATVLVWTVSAATVTDVKVKALDGFGGDTGAVLGHCQTKPGAEYDPMTVTRDVNTLKASNVFEEISADANETEGGVEVVFYVKRKVRFVPPLTVEGNDFFSISRITKEAQLKDGFLYGESDLAEAAARVRLAYLKKGFAHAKVTPRVEVLAENAATIVMMIDEGPRQRVRSVVFEGATHAIETGAVNRNLNPFHALKDNEFEAVELRDAVGDYPWWNPIGWFSESRVTNDQRAQGCGKIAEVYRKHGYLDVEVSGPQSVPAEDGYVDLVYKVVEGPCYRVGAISVTGLTRYKQADIIAPVGEAEPGKRVVPPAEGTVAGQELIDEIARRIRVLVGSGPFGLADSQVDVRWFPTEGDESVLDFEFHVIEGVPVVVNDIVVRNNDYTKDSVIRREIRLDPGRPMLEDAAENSQRRLENLGYFSRVRYYLEATELGTDSNGAELRDLVYEVEEKNTGAFMVGIGASSVDSVYVQAEVNQNNFDLFAPSKMFRGAGQKGRAYVAWGPRYQSAELGFVEPYFCSRMLELSVDAYRRLRWYDQYDLIRSGGAVSLSYPVKFWPSWEAFGRFGVGLSCEYIQMDDVEKDEYVDSHGNDVSFKEEEHRYGDAVEPVLHFFWSKDARDNVQIPTEGYRARVFADVAPAGDNKYWRAGLNYRHYWTVWERYGHVLMAGIRAETIDGISDDVPIYNRMFLGGPKSIRGIEYRNVSPKVRRDDSSHREPWGGQSLWCANFEYTVPIVKMFRVAVFSDVGSVGDDEFDFGGDVAWTAGFGFRLDIPMFPIRLDFATPITCPSHTEKEFFSFTVGYDF